VPAATAKGIVVMNTPGGNTVTTAEHALALLIAVEVIPDIFRTLGNVMMDVAVSGAVARGDRSEG